MRTIGLLGGITWHSTLEYYRLINEGVHRRPGGSHSARCILFSVDFDEIERLQEMGDWDSLGTLSGKAARSVESAGAAAEHRGAAAS
jgi:aspartate racemase